MKKILILVFCIFCFGSAAIAKDILPAIPNVVTVNTVGLYQVGHDIKIYKMPTLESPILYRVRWNEKEFFPDDIGAEHFFTVYKADKDLAMVSVVDIADDWVEIVYDNKSGKTGWIQSDDPYKFMTWINFYNSYGKKYGLTLLKGAPQVAKDLKSAPDEKAQNLSSINVPQKIKLNLIQGNWALISVMDLDRIPKTGYVRWRSDDGVRYFFPALK